MTTLLLGVIAASLVSIAANVAGIVLWPWVVRIVVVAVVLGVGFVGLVVVVALHEYGYVTSFEIATFFSIGVASYALQRRTHPS